MILVRTALALFALTVVTAKKEEGPTKLYRAMADNKTAEVMELLKKKADPDEQVMVDGCKTSLLHLAVSRGDAHVARQLVFFGADPNTTACFGQTPLHRAVREDKLEVVKGLAAMPGVDPHREPISTSPMVLAVVKNSPDMVKALLSGGADPDVLTREGQTPVELAMESESFQVIPVLAAHGAKINYTYPGNDTYLHRAVRSGNLPSTAFLLSRGADVDAVNSKGETPLAIAVNRNDRLMAEMILNRKKGLTDEEKSLYLTAQKNNDDRLVHRLLLMGGSAPQKNTTNSPPKADVNQDMRIAVLANKPGLVRKYGTLGADPNGTVENQSLLTYAISKGFDDVTRELLNLGANVECKDHEGWTALCVAAFHGRAAVTKMLVERGANKNVRCTPREKETPLYIATKRKHEDVASLLLDLGADPNAATAQHWTPLHRATTDGVTPIVRVLVDHDADVKVVNNEGKTPLDIAQEKGIKEIVILITNKASQSKAKKKHPRKKYSNIQVTRHKNGGGLNVVLTSDGEHYVGSRPHMNSFNWGGIISSIFD